MPDCVHISGLAAHQIPRPVAVVKGKIFLQQFAVHRVTHAVKHPLRTGFKHHLCGITKDRTHCRHCEHNADQFRQKVVRASLNHIINDHSGNVRIYNRACDNDRHQHESDHDRQPVFFQKSGKPF